MRRKNEQIYSVRDRLSDENKQYLPKFLAVCKIVRNLDKLGFSCATFASSSQIAEVRAKPGTDLMLFSKSIGMSWEEFSAHNPAYQRYVSHPSRSTKIYVPRAMAGKAQALLFKLPPANSGKSYAGLRDYKISRGDTMASISRKTGCSGGGTPAHQSGQRTFACWPCVEDPRNQPDGRRTSRVGIRAGSSVGKGDVRCVRRASSDPFAHGFRFRVGA